MENMLYICKIFAEMEVKMVYEIKLANFFSIKDEVVLDFRAANLKSYITNSLSNNVFETDKAALLKTLVIYGANASGKSNIVKAIRFCNSMVIHSHNHNENTVFKFQPFKFDGFEDKPSSFFIRFSLNTVEYEYSFTLQRSKILTESLHFYPKGRIKEIFTRNESLGNTKKEKYSFTDVIRRPMDVAENTSDKTLFISRASQMDRDIAKDVFNFFSSTFILDYMSFGFSAIEDISVRNKNQLLSALRIADSDIDDVQIKVLKKKVQMMNSEVPALSLNPEDVLREYLLIKTYHKKHPGVAFDFLTEESEGTIRLFFIMLTLLSVIKHNKFLLIDEIEESLHPRITEYIFNLFRAGEKAQLLCTTHNTWFLDLKKFRKDQVYFTNKKPDGATDLYSLYDYSDFRDTMDLEKAYLQGRFDAIPMVNDSADDLKYLLNEQ
jgi:AAA15 family ATPase/GTPase